MTSTPPPQGRADDVDVSIDDPEDVASAAGGAADGAPALTTDPEAQVDDSPVDPSAS